MEEPRALCAYCRTTAAVGDSIYCCIGCESLAGLSGDRELPSHAVEDERLIRDYGKTVGDAVEFECTVEPLACEACVQALARLPESFPAVSELEWHRGRSVLRFRFAKDRALPTGFFDILRRLKLEPRWREPGAPGEGNEAMRQRLIRVGITGALAANIMMFAVPIYGGLDGDLRFIFEIVQAVLFIPVFFWCAIPIFRTAWMALKLRFLSVDLPLAVAFVLGSVFSATSLAQGSHDIYFDSLAGFLFLILASRFILERSLANHLRSPRLGELFENPHFAATRDGREIFLPWHGLRPGDLVTLGANDRLPVDGVLETRSAEFDTSWMTGEVMPVLRFKGAPLKAGIRLISKNAVIAVTSTAEDTEFARVVSRLETGGEKLEGGGEARVGTALVLGCFALIGVLLAFAGTIGFTESLRRSLALLIVACPCAVSFAAPLARARATRLARARGFWIRRSHVWRRLAHPARIAFDKTGTLTDGNLTVAPHSPMIDARWKQIILSLENVSAHPVAESLRRSWGPIGTYTVANAREIPGEGVEGVIEGQFYEFKKVAGDTGSVSLSLRRNGQALMDVELQDQVRPRTREAFANLGKDHQLFIVSGDSEERVFAFADTMKVPRERASGNLKPDEKARALDRIHPDLYFGDGTNDIPALRKAPVSFATGGAALEAKAASDVLMLDADLARLPMLFEIARETEKLIRRNFIIALVYNVGAGLAAVDGAIHPLIAAVLMPAISLALAASTIWGTRGLRRMEEGIA